MLRLIVTILLAVFLTAPPLGAEPVTTIRNHGDPANRVDITILGDGYTQAELPKYATDIERFIQGLFAQEPYKEYQRFFNVHRVDVISNESGADHPEYSVNRDTALNATYNCAGIQRLICVSTSKVNEVLLRSLPAEQRDVVLVIVNDTEYGGSGGIIAVASLHFQVIELILHELGHTLGLLADEYGGPPPPTCNAASEPNEVNVTKTNTPAQIKWRPWIDAATLLPTIDSLPAVPGLYPGGKYCDTGLYRPTYNSKMRSLNVPFEQINTEQLIKRIYNWVSPIDTVEPVALAVSLTQGTNETFRVHVPAPLTGAMTISWLLNGQPVGNTAAITLQSAGLTAGSHTLQVIVTDQTLAVRSDPTELLSDVEAWSLTIIGQPDNKPIDIPIKPIDVPIDKPIDKPIDVPTDKPIDVPIDKPLELALPKLVNISTRGLVQAGDNVLIGGFVIQGATSKLVLIRARGPSMAGAPFNVPGTLADPLIKLFTGSTMIAQNDNWLDTPDCGAFTCGAVSATKLDPCQPNPGQATAPPNCHLEAALLITLSPGAYTAIVSGVNGSTGIGLIEVFDQ
jgi:hypothetical protein